MEAIYSSLINLKLSTIRIYPSSPTPLPLPSSPCQLFWGYEKTTVVTLPYQESSTLLNLPISGVLKRPVKFVLRCNYIANSHKKFLSGCDFCPCSCSPGIIRFAVYFGPPFMWNRDRNWPGKWCSSQTKGWSFSSICRQIKLFFYFTWYLPFLLRGLIYCSCQMIKC